MTTDLQASPDFRAPQQQDAYAMQAAGVKEIIGVLKVDGQEKLVVNVENHPGFRSPRFNDSFQMAAEGVKMIKGAIETGRKTILVGMDQRHCTI